MTRNINSFYLVLVCFIALSFTSCRPTRNVPKDEYLLDKMTVKVKNITLDKDEVNAIIKQKPNRKILSTIRFHLGVYNAAHRGKSNKFKRWLERTIGEEPVILDTNLTKKSAKQLKLYLNKKGYFKAVVIDSTTYHKKKAHIQYRLITNKPYRINKIIYDINDPKLIPFIYQDTARCLIKKGNIYDEDDFSKEQLRLTSHLRNKGFYQFQKEFIYFEADTTVGNRLVNLTIAFLDKNYNTHHPDDTTFVENHLLFQIEHVYIYPAFDFQKKEQLFKDTLKIGNFTSFCYNDYIKYRTNTLLCPLFLGENDLFDQRLVDNTYQRYSALKVFKALNIDFKFTREDKDKGYLDAYIKLSPRKPQSYSVSTEGTNSSGNLGINGSIAYQNRNIFRGAETFEIKLKGALEVQQISVETNKTFNTKEIGPEVSFSIPRFLLPFAPKCYLQKSNPKTTITAVFNYQQRPDYTRIVATAAYSYIWKPTRFLQYFYTPVDINYVWINKSDAFNKFLDNINDVLIKQSYFPLLIPSFLKFGFVYNNQELKSRTNHTFLRMILETAGNLPTWYNEIAGIPKRMIIQDGDTIYAHKILGLPYSQFIRTEVDFRKYFDFGLLRKLVLRANIGLGVPYGNAQALPFVRSFYAGGTNDIRAWTARSLGPGTYPSSQVFEQIGDVKFTGNVEYRSNIFKALYGAIFMDFGNIWLLHPQITRPGGEFLWSKFYKQFAYGSGVGLRYDFSFFIVRLDLGVPIWDPAQIKGSELEIFNKPLTRIKYNIGIGYPF